MEHEYTTDEVILANKTYECDQRITQHKSKIKVLEFELGKEKRKLNREIKRKEIVQKNIALIEKRWVEAFSWLMNKNDGDFEKILLEYPDLNKRKIVKDYESTLIAQGLKVYFQYQSNRIMSENFIQKEEILDIYHLSKCCKNLQLMFNKFFDKNKFLQ
jgi:hypothetical protein